MSNLPYFLLNGAPQDTIALSNRGLAYGDGVFETMLVINGEIPLWSHHHNRLLKGLVFLGISLESQRLRYELDEVLAIATDQSHEYCLLKLIVTRGTSQRGYLPDNNQSADIIFQLLPFAIDAEKFQGVRVHICQQRLQPVSWAGLKTLNQLPYVLAAQERVATDYDEGIVLNSNDDIIEATSRNVFIVKDETVYTPIINDCGVEGIMRQCLLETVISQLNLSVEETKLTQNDLFAADEVFLANSVTGIWPVIQCEDKHWQVGTVTRSVQSLCHHLFHH